MILILDLARVAEIRASSGFEAPNPENIHQKMLMAVSEITEAQGELRNGRSLTHRYLAVQTGFWCIKHHDEQCKECMAPHVGVTRPASAAMELPSGWERYELSKPEGFGIEIADAILRLADIAYANGIDLQSCIDDKMAFNAQRPLHHGGTRVF